MEAKSLVASSELVTAAAASGPHPLISLNLFLPYNLTHFEAIVPDAASSSLLSSFAVGTSVLSFAAGV